MLPDEDYDIPENLDDEQDESEDDAWYEEEITNCEYDHYKFSDGRIIKPSEFIELSEEEQDKFTQDCTEGTASMCDSEGNKQIVECEINWDSEQGCYRCTTCGRFQ